MHRVEAEGTDGLRIASLRGDDLAVVRQLSSHQHEALEPEFVGMPQRIHPLIEGTIRPQAEPRQFVRIELWLSVPSVRRVANASQAHAYILVIRTLPEVAAHYAGEVHRVCVGVTIQVRDGVRIVDPYSVFRGLIVGHFYLGNAVVAGKIKCRMTVAITDRINIPTAQLRADCPAYSIDLVVSWVMNRFTESLNV